MIIDWLILTNKLTNWCTQMLMDGWWGVCEGSCRGWGVARALLYIVRASPSFLLHPSYQSFYRTFHQVMSPDRRAYSFNKHFIVLYSCDRWPYMPHPSLPPARNDKMQRCHGSTADPSHAEIEFYMMGRSAWLLGWFSWFMAFGGFPHCGGVPTTQSLFSYQWG